MDSYSILGVHKDSSMEDIEKAYRDKVSKIKEEVKNEKNAASFEALLTEAYNDILNQKEILKAEDSLDEETLESEMDDWEDDDYDDLEYEDFEDGQVIDKETFYRSLEEEEEDDDYRLKRRNKKKKKKKRSSSKREESKAVKKNDKLDDDDFDKYKNKPDKNYDREKINESKKGKRVKEKKGINILGILLLPLKILAVPIIIVLSILLVILKLISFATWIVSKILIVAAIAVASIHGYQIYMGTTMDVKIFIFAASVGVVSIFIPYIVKTMPAIIEAINNKLKDFVF